MTATNDLILTEQDGAVLVVTLNRPDKANALTTRMLQQLADVFARAGETGELRALLLTGAGERAFCAGADLNELHEQTAQTGDTDVWTQMASNLRALPILSIAMLNGACMGGGLTLALGCDVRLSVPHAQFQYPVLMNNVLPAQYDVDSLLQLTGAGRTSSLLLGGEKITATEAHDWGLVDRLVEAADLTACARALAATAIDADPQHLSALKALIRRGQS